MLVFSVVAHCHELGDFFVQFVACQFSPLFLLEFTLAS